MNEFARSFINGPGGEALLFTALATTLLSTLAILCAMANRRRAAVRHAIMMAGLLACLATVPVAIARAMRGDALVAIPVLAPKPTPIDLSEPPADRITCASDSCECGQQP